MPLNIKFFKVTLPVATAATAALITANLLFTNRQELKDNKENEDILDDYEKELEKYEEEIVKTSSDEAESEAGGDQKQAEAPSEEEKKVEEKIKEELQKSNKEQLLKELLTEPEKLIEKLSLENDAKLSPKEITELAGKMQELVKKASGPEQGDSQSEEEAADKALETQPQGDPAQEADFSKDQNEDRGNQAPVEPSEKTAQDQPFGAEMEVDDGQLVSEEDSKKAKASEEEGQDLLSEPSLPEGGPEPEGTQEPPSEIQNESVDSNDAIPRSPESYEEDFPPAKAKDDSDTELDESGERSDDTSKEAQGTTGEGEEVEPVASKGGKDGREDGHEEGTGEFPISLETWEALMGEVSTALGSLSRIIRK